MGVWHFSGLGKSPGALTVPLTCIYFFLKQADKNDDDAKDFFSLSGEYSQKSNELKGLPEALIIFTSEDVINNRIDFNFEDRWFNTKGKNIDEIIYNYIKKLTEKLFNTPRFPKYFHFVKVEHTNFDDCFKKSYLTLSALTDKEIWINMVGGTNQINSALLIANSLTGRASKCYYVFQEDTKKLHLLNKPNFENPRIDISSCKWVELPFIFLDFSGLLKALNEEFKNKPAINKSLLKHLLSSLNFPDSLIPKLVTSKIISFKGSDTVVAGKNLSYWSNMISDIQSINISNYSSWKKYFEENEWLYSPDID